MDFHWHDIEADPQAWDRQLASLRQSLFNLSALLSVHAFGNARRRGVLLCRHGRPLALLGGLVRETAAGVGFESLCFPTVTGADGDSLLADLVAWLQAQGIARIKFGSFSGGVEHYAVDRASFAVTERLEFPWDLSVSETARRKLLRSNHKRKLNKLGDQALQLTRIDRYQPWLMTRAHAQWAQRKGERPGWADLIKMYRYYRLLHGHLTRAGIGVLYGLYDGRGRLLSVAYMLEYGDLTFYMIGASSPEGYRISASMKLFWDMARLYSDKGFRYLHLGGVPGAALAEQHQEHGVYRFKQGFGITPALRLTLSTHS